jgi:naphthalene 1,2-dioxygenase ferredoxin component
MAQVPRCERRLDPPGCLTAWCRRTRRGNGFMSNWVEAAKAADFADGDVRGIEIGDQAIAIYQVEGAFFATDNVCTHAFALLSDGFLDDCTIECPLHAGRFDIRTGKALGRPVTRDLKSYPVKVEDGAVLIDLG